MRLNRIRRRFAFGFARGFRFVARRLCATARHASLARRTRARQNPPFVFQQQFLLTTPGDDRPPGRSTQSMNRYLNT
jgi:hypothetical protein